MLLENMYFIVPLNKFNGDLFAEAEGLLQKRNTLIASGDISEKSRVLFVSDCSSASSAEAIYRVRETSQCVEALFLSSENNIDVMLTAGLHEVLVKGADAVVTMPIGECAQYDVIDLLLAEYRKGFETVTLNPGSHVFIADKRVLQAFAEYGESDIDVSEALDFIGFKSLSLNIGQTKKKKEQHCKPIWYAALLLLVSVFTALGGLISLIIEAVRNAEITGAILLLSAGVLGCMVSASLLIISGYLAMSDKDGKHRPRFVIDKRLQQ